MTKWLPSPSEGNNMAASEEKAFSAMQPPQIWLRSGHPSNVLPAGKKVQFGLLCNDWLLCSRKRSILSFCQWKQRSGLVNCPHPIPGVYLSVARGAHFLMNPERVQESCNRAWPVSGNHSVRFRPKLNQDGYSHERKHWVRVSVRHSGYDGYMCVAFKAPCKWP